mmetsp:Transcript_1613/g.3618  ORF Transcript_1613/g.3618 Transcript_1613/m.3618 type:complete len:204 (+) Transcript_1613:1291-1902(+)
MYAAIAMNATNTLTSATLLSWSSPADAGICMTMYGMAVSSMAPALMQLSESAVAPVLTTSYFLVSRSSMETPACRLHLPMMSEPPHPMVSSIAVDPASVPMPTAILSAASSGAPPSPLNMTISVSGSAPSTGNSSPPMRPASRTSQSCSEPSAMRFAPNRTMRPYMAMRMTDPPRDDEHGQIPHVSEHGTREALTIEEGDMTD